MDGTRVGILRDLDLWCRDERAPCIFWLDGMAGTGKSAIARTFSRSLRKENLLGGSFFCSRGSAAREDTKRIIPTLAASLARRDSGYRDALLHTLDDNKDLTVHSNLDEQLE
jgi:cytidylate kinase